MRKVAPYLVALMWGALLLGGAAAGVALAALGWKGPGAWAFAPLLAAAAIASFAAALAARPPGHRAAYATLLVSLAMVLADLAGPAGRLPGGISSLQAGAALVGTAAWLWTSRRGSDL